MSDEQLPCESLSVGDWFGWTMVSGKRIEGVVVEIDSNVVIVTDSAGNQWAYES